jgi:hypothetical protein
MNILHRINVIVIIQIDGIGEDYFKKYNNNV